MITDRFGNNIETGHTVKRVDRPLALSGIVQSWEVNVSDTNRRYEVGVRWFDGEETTEHPSALRSYGVIPRRDSDTSTTPTPVPPPPQHTDGLEEPPTGPVADTSPPADDVPPTIEEAARMAFGSHMRGLCSVCGKPISFYDSPGGSWWAHDVHPEDEHDAAKLP